MWLQRICWQPKDNANSKLVLLFAVLWSYIPHQNLLWQHGCHLPRSSDNQTTPLCRGSQCTECAGFFPERATSWILPALNSTCAECGGRQAQEPAAKKSHSWITNSIEHVDSIVDPVFIHNHHMLSFIHLFNHSVIQSFIPIRSKPYIAFTLIENHNNIGNNLLNPKLSTMALFEESIKFILHWTVGKIG